MSNPLDIQGPSASEIKAREQQKQAADELAVKHCITMSVLSKMVKEHPFCPIVRRFSREIDFLANEHKTHRETEHACVIAQISELLGKLSHNKDDDYKAVSKVLKALHAVDGDAITFLDRKTTSAPLEKLPAHLVEKYDLKFTSEAEDHINSLINNMR